VAPTLDAALLNNATTMAVAFTVADGASFVVFGADSAGRHFVGGTSLTVTATFSDGTSATGGTTVAAAAPPPPATIAVTYHGKARDRVGQGNTALAADGALDGTLTLTLNATGGRTVTAIRMQSTTAGTWDTTAATGYWVLGVAPTATGALLNNPTSMAVTASVAAGGSLSLFGSDWAGRHFVTGTILTVTATFSDGTSAKASTTVGGAATVTLAYNGKLRDRMGQGNTRLGPDGMLDGTLTATLRAGGARTVTAIRLQSGTSGIWDTSSATTYWAVGVAPSLDAALVNATATMAVNFSLAEGGSFVLFASDSAGRHFLRGTPLTVAVSFSDGSSATALAQVP
jgi:hypothetical protein